MESNVSAVSWLHGLQDYLGFQEDLESKKYVDFLLHMVYANDPVISLNNNAGLVEFVGTLRKFANNDILDNFHKYYRTGNNPKLLQDAFSRGQVQSKIWLVNELSKIQQNFNTVFVLAGWFGQITSYLDSKIEYNKLRLFDMDKAACKVSDSIFNLKHINDYKVKSVEMTLPLWSDSEEDQNMSWILRTGCEYNIVNYNNGKSFKEKLMPDLVVNTSAEHMSSIWYDKFVNRPMETDPLFVIQTNNLFDVIEHHNCVHSIDHMLKKFKMSRVEYAGEIELFGYKRFMLIGRP